jgi:hypothetical protein
MKRRRISTEATIQDEDQGEDMDIDKVMQVTMGILALRISNSQ